MNKLQVIKEFTIYLNIAIMATIFSVASLAFNTDYIYYGLITFAYAVIAHLLDLAFHNVFEELNLGKKRVLFFLQFILVAIWLGIMLLIHM